jgi:hypothetical protein
MPNDVQELLERLREADRDLEEDVDVTFTFSHPDFDYLIPLAEEIGDLFAIRLRVDLDSVVIEYNEHPKPDSLDSAEKPDPQFSLCLLGPLTAEQFEMLHDLAAERAKQHSLTYRGVTWW